MFSNCGAGDVGFASAGFTFDVIAELVPYRIKVAAENHPNATAICGDLRETWKQVVSAYREKRGNAELSLLAACPPCQGMSSVNSGRGNMHDADAGSRDKRNLLVTVIASVARELRPRMVVVENVPAFLSRKVRHPLSGRAVSASVLLMDELAMDYECFAAVVDMASFGVPQSRKRAFLTFIRKDLAGLSMLNRLNLVPFPRPIAIEDRVTLCEALKASGAPPLDAASPEYADGSWYDPLHFVPVWDNRLYEMVKAIPSNSGLSAWQNNKCTSCECLSDDDDAASCKNCGSLLPRPVVLDKRTNKWRLVKGFRSSSYRRMRPNQAARTITTASGHIGSSYTLHPNENRVFSAFECSVLQTFPRDFKWGSALNTVGHTNVREMIGEAVPPLFTEMHGRVLVNILRSKLSMGVMSTLDAETVKAVNLLQQARGKKEEKTG